QTWEKDVWQELTAGDALLSLDSIGAVVIMSTDEVGTGTQFLLDFVDDEGGDGDSLPNFQKSEDFALLYSSTGSGQLTLDSNVLQHYGQHLPVSVAVRGYLVSRAVTARGAYHKQSDFHLQRYSVLELNVYS